MPNLQTVLQASRAHSVKGRKSANDNFYAAVQAAAAQQLQNQALRNAGMLGAVGLGTGAAARGLQGLVQLINRNVNKPRRSYPTSVPVDMPLHEEEEPKTASLGAVIGGAIGSAFGQRPPIKPTPAPQPAAPPRVKYIFGGQLQNPQPVAPLQQKGAGVADFLKGEYAQSVSGVPWAMPAAVGAGAAGLMGGWSAMDYLLDKRRKGDLQAELEKAKEEYEAALMASTAGKTAAEGTLARDLDDLFDEMTKKASSWADLAGRGAGAYGIYGGLAGLTTALLAYNWDKKRQRRALIDKALKERRKRRFSQQPAAMYVRPQQNAPQVPQSMQTAPPIDEGLEF